MSRNYTRLRNKRELVLRARGHARMDRLTQGTYGEAYVNGHVDYRGCAIGCLAVPHRGAELLRFVKERREASPLAHLDSPGVWFPMVDEHLRELERSFGISEAMMRRAELVFEALPFHGAAIEFVPAFTEALPEGVIIHDTELPRDGRYMDSYDQRDALLRFLRAREGVAA